MILFLQSLHTRFIPVYTGLECINTYYKTIREWLIPVCTGRMPYPYQGCHLCLGSSPRIQGRLWGIGALPPRIRFIPAYTGQILNPSGRFPCLVSHCFPSPWTFATEPVCTILDSHIFADNTFWSILARNDACPPIFLWGIPRRHHIFAPLTAFLGHSQTRI